MGLWTGGSSYEACGNSRNGCRTSAIARTKEEPDTLCLFEDGTATFLSLDDDIMYLKRSCPATIPRPFILGVCGLRPYRMAVLSFVRFSHARVLLSMAYRHGRVSCPCRRNRIPYHWHTCVFPFPRSCSPIKFTHGHVARPWGFIASHVFGKSCPTSTQPYRKVVFLPLLGHGLRHAYVPGHVC
ncbi:hypothetical protein GOBAR_AA10635 [Gossypium barbadense]|uniref:Uncharacterized protein n=1 Tax=Gossypium barbadense TaxID=3634 RepID=A0A2P5Y360_GOSBA|nr:hypothetical protein GOBAR_AA10635 [Gossypium barbadense]